MGKILFASLLLGPLVALPALAWKGDELAELRARLTSTVSSIGFFSSMQERLAARDPKAIGDLLAASEIAPDDDVQAEIDLLNLRARVAELQEILDGRPDDGASPPHSNEAAAPNALAVVHAPAKPPADATPSEQPGATPTVQNTNKLAFEGEGFVADRARLGRACWRGGRYSEGVAALEPIAGDPQADYWRARCLEKLARHGEAIDLYHHVIEVAGESPEGRSAREDIEFLEWSIAHGLVTAP